MAGSDSSIPSIPPIEARPLVIMSSRSGEASRKASSVIGFIPSQPISAATSIPPIELIRSSAPEPVPKM